MKLHQDALSLLPNLHLQGVGGRPEDLLPTMSSPFPPAAPTRLDAGLLLALGPDDPQKSPPGRGGSIRGVTWGVPTTCVPSFLCL